MKLNLFKKCFIIVIIVFFVGSNSILTITSIKIDKYTSTPCDFNENIMYIDGKEYEEPVEKIYDVSSNQKGLTYPVELYKSPLQIVEINDGLGLKILVKNVGMNNIGSVTLNVNITGGLKIKLPVTSYYIPILYSGKSSLIPIEISGIGLGIVTKLPLLKFILKAPNEESSEKWISARIIGPLVIKTEEFSNDPRVFDGYTLFGPEYSSYVYLINNDGEIVHDWASAHIQGLGLYLLENGNIIRSSLPYVNPTFVAGGVSGCVEVFDWNGTLVWKFEYSTDQYCLHHDIEVLPNGNILMIAWEYKTIEEANSEGRNTTLDMRGIWPDHVIEVEPTGTNGGNIVWEWHVWDHLIQDYDPTKNNYGIVGDHPELIDVNCVRGDDWNHINSIDYNEELDQILLSSRNQCEIWVIDHSTTTEEAADRIGGRYGKGGDLLYRWGNPQVYRAGDQNDRKLFGQHDAQWIESGCPGEGNILIFNNGPNRPNGMYSSVDEIVPPIRENGSYVMIPGSAIGPEEPIWIYNAEKLTDFYSGSISGAQRLPNGNTLICEGFTGKFFEVTQGKEIVWDYNNQLPYPISSQVFKIRRYSPDYPGLEDLFD